jgi:hypothetical protein
VNICFNVIEIFGLFKIVEITLRIQFSRTKLFSSTIRIPIRFFVQWKNNENKNYLIVDPYILIQGH